MKTFKLLNILTLMMLMFLLSACSDPIQQAAQQMQEGSMPPAVQQQPSGMGAGTGALLGGAAGYMLGKMGSNRQAAPQIVQQRTVIHHYVPSRPRYSNYGGSRRSYSSSRSYGGRRR